MNKATLLFASLMLCLIRGAYAQTAPDANISVCIEHIGTRGFAEASLFGTPMIVSSSKAAFGDCHKDFVTRTGEDKFAISWVVSPTLVRSLVAELGSRPS